MLLLALPVAPLLASLDQHADAMRFAVADVDRASCVGEHTMRPGQRAPQRVSVGAIAALPDAEDGSDDASLEIDPANDVILGIGHEQLIA
jgi:hypothetical protein